MDSSQVVKSLQSVLTLPFTLTYYKFVPFEGLLLSPATALSLLFICFHFHFSQAHVNIIYAVALCCVPQSPPQQIQHLFILAYSFLLKQLCFEIVPLSEAKHYDGRFGGFFGLVSGGIVNVNTVTGQLFQKLRDFEPDLTHMLLSNQDLHFFSRLPTQLKKIIASSLPHFPT